MINKKKKKNSNRIKKRENFQNLEEDSCNL